MKCIIYCLFFSLFYIGIEAFESSRKQSAEQLLRAFNLQCNAHSYTDSYSACVVFNCAKAQLLEMGESQDKINAIQSLWTWYRTYGYNCGLTLEPVRCPGEYISDKKYVPKTTHGNNFDPKQQQMLRDFLFGVGSIISGVFCIAINPPIGGNFGGTLITTGAVYIWNSINSMVTDSQQQLPLKRIF